MRQEKALYIPTLLCPYTTVKKVRLSKTDIANCLGNVIPVITVDSKVILAETEFDSNVALLRWSKLTDMQSLELDLLIFTHRNSAL